MGTVRNNPRRLACTALLLFGMQPGLLPAAETDAGTDTAVGPPAETPAEAAPDPACAVTGSDGSALVDRMQQRVYLSVCNSARWFDGLFGTGRYDQDSRGTFGRVGVYQLWDDRDGFDARLRLRVRADLPALENRLQLVFGRAEDREITEDTEPAAGGDLPGNFREVEDESWLLGLGYSNQDRLANGFDFGIGVRLRSPIDPYTKASYRHNFLFSDATALRARQTVFWRDSRGFGETTELDLDFLLSPELLLRWDNTVTLAEDVRRPEWNTGLIAFQSLGDRRALSYTAFVSGIANTDVPVRNYGVELRYRRSILRDWLFIEGRTSLTWPRELPEEERESNPGVGLGFEMYFGRGPQRELR